MERAGLSEPRVMRRGGRERTSQTNLVCAILRRVLTSPDAVPPKKMRRSSDSSLTFRRNLLILFLNFRGGTRMSRKSPGLLALLVRWGLLIGRPLRSAADRRPSTQPIQGQTVSGVVKVTGWVLDFNARWTRSSSSSMASFANRADIESAAGRRPRGLPDLRQQRNAESRLRLLVPREPRLRATVARDHDPGDRVGAGRSSRSDR